MSARHPRNSTTRTTVDRGELSSVALMWLLAGLVVVSFVAALGWYQASNDDDDPAATEWPGLSATGGDIFDCPAGTVVGHLAIDDPLVVVARANGNAWLAILDPDDGTTRVWVLASSVTLADSSVLIGALPHGACGIPRTDTFSSTVVDSVTGVPVPGVTVTATDEAGELLPEYSAVTAEDGTYTIAGLTEDEYGIYMDGTAVGYEAGYTGSSPTAFGYPVDSWNESSTVAPGLMGDIALDAQGTAPTDGTTTTVTGETTTTVAPTTAAPSGNQPPTIVSVSASPAEITPSALCGRRSTVLTVEVTDDERVDSVKVEWTYQAIAFADAPSQAVGTIPLVQVGETTWQGTLTVWMQPATPPDPRFIEMKVTAVDGENLQWWRNFNRTVAVKRC